MRIEDSDIRLIKDWVDSHWEGEPLCAICKNNNWTIGKTIAELRPFLKGKLSMGGFLYPAVIFSCNVCGYTLFFNAIQLGIVKRPPPIQAEIMIPKELKPPKDAIPPKEKEGDDNG